MVAQAICPFLKDVNELKVRSLSGGLSNELFVISLGDKVDSSSSSSSHFTPVLVRIHPSEENALVDRDTENKLVAWLSKQGMAPMYFGRFENGRVEEFYPSVLPLKSQEMQLYAAKLGKALSAFHKLEVPESILAKPTSRIPDRFRTIDQWVASISTANQSGSEVMLCEQISTEWAWLREQLLLEPVGKNKVQSSAIQYIHGMVLTHMDCQSLNILKPTNACDGGGKIQLIDFEYAGWNPRAADLANTFCEFCDMNNLKADYKREYPSEICQNIFLEAYLEGSFLGKPPETALDVMRREIGRYTLLSHLGWAAWSIIMAGSAIDFDYIGYARHRMAGYQHHKEQFFSNDNAK